MTIQKISENKYVYKNFTITQTEDMVVISNGTDSYTMFADTADKISDIESEIVGFIEVNFDAYVDRIKEKSEEILSNNSEVIRYPQCESCTFRDADFSKVMCQVYDIKPDEYDYEINKKCPFFLEGDYSEDTDIRL